MTEKKRAPELRFKGFDGEWERRKLGEVLTEKRRPIKMEDTTNYQLVTVKRRNEGIVSRGYFQGKNILVKNYYEVSAGDYLISKRQVVHGANGLVPEHLDKSIVSNEYLVFIGNEEATAEYLALISNRNDMYKHFFLSSYGIDIEKLVFDIADWNKRKIHLPVQGEQEKLVSLFHHLDQLITHRQRKRDKLKILKQAMLGKLFPREGADVPELRFAGFTGKWEKHKLSEIAEIVTGGTPNTSVADYWNPKEVPWLSSGEVNKKRIEQTDEKISSKGLLSSSARWVKEGAVLIALAGQGKTRGTVAITYIPLTTNQSLAAIIPSEKYSGEFIFQSLESRYDELRASSSGDGIRGGLNKQIISEIEVKFPCVDEQSKIGSFFKRLDQLITLQQRELAKLKNIKQALLDKMFV